MDYSQQAKPIQGYFIGGVSVLTTGEGTNEDPVRHVDESDYKLTNFVQKQAALLSDGQYCYMQFRTSIVKIQAYGIAVFATPESDILKSDPGFLGKALDACAAVNSSRRKTYL